RGSLFAPPLGVEAAPRLLHTGFPTRLADRGRISAVRRWSSAAAALLIVLAIGAAARISTQPPPTLTSAPSRPVGEDYSLEPAAVAPAAAKSPSPETPP